MKIFYVDSCTRSSFINARFNFHFMLSPISTLQPLFFVVFPNILLVASFLGSDNLKFLAQTRSGSFKTQTELTKLILLGRMSLLDAICGGLFVHSHAIIRNFEDALIGIKGNLNSKSFPVFSSIN